MKKVNTGDTGGSNTGGDTDKDKEGGQDLNTKRVTRHR